MRKLLIALAAGCMSAAAPAATQPPRLVIAVSVDQLSSDLWDQFRPHFRGGLKRLGQGIVFRNGYQSHAATETCPGHSTLLSGRRPASNGIIANLWIDQSITRADKSVYCAEDERVPGTTSTAYRVSPHHFAGLTLGERLKAANPASRSVAVAGKDRAAVMMGGRALDQRWYWDGKAFATDLQAVSVPKSLTAFRAALAASLATARPPLEPPALCQAKSRAYQLSPSVKVGDNRLGRAAGDARAFRMSPELDGATLALAAALTQEMGLGRGKATDLLSISLSATDYIGHAYGGDGMEMCLQLLALDRELGDFFALLDRAGLDYAVMLTADHGGMDIPERLREKGVADAARADPLLAAAEVGKLLAPRFGRTEGLLKGSGIGGDIWLDTAIPSAQRPAVLAAAIARFRGHPQVYGAWSKAEIAAVPMPSGDPRGWSVQQRLRASFDPHRSGDILLVLKPNISPIAAPSPGYVAGHGSPWDYDRRVPILFWRKGGPARTVERAVETVDILPTLAAGLGLALDRSGIDGQCLPEAVSACPR